MSNIHERVQSEKERLRRRQQGLYLLRMAPPRTAPVQPYIVPAPSLVQRAGHFLWNATRHRAERRFGKPKGRAAARAAKKARQRLLFGSAHKKFSRRRTLAA